MIKENWQKIASVTNGGKPYFYVRFDNRGKLTIVWDRTEYSYCIVRNDAAVLARGFKTIEASIKYAETNNL